MLSRELIAFESIVEQLGTLAGYKRRKFTQDFPLGLEGELAGREARTIALNLDIKGREVDENGESILVVDALEFSQEDATNLPAAKVMVRMIKP